MSLGRILTVGLALISAGIVARFTGLDRVSLI